jgi:hypothetical protein
MSTFIMALGQIFRDLVYFMIVLVVVILMFSDVRTRMTSRDCSESSHNLTTTSDLLAADVSDRNVSGQCSGSFHILLNCHFLAHTFSIIGIQYDKRQRKLLRYVREQVPGRPTGWGAGRLLQPRVLLLGPQNVRRVDRRLFRR